jgi:hypothetical protein
MRPIGGTLTIATVRQRKRIGHLVTLFLGAGNTGYTTSARVQRAAPPGQSGTCADAQTSQFGSNIESVATGDSITIRLLKTGGSLLQTRCAGPLDGDLAAVSPAVTVSLARALHGGTTLRLPATQTFSVHGFAGTISSTLVLKLGRPSRQPVTSNPNFPRGLKTQRTRIVTERLRVARVQGELSAAVRGTSDPDVCALLDTCGLSGTLTLGVATGSVTGQVVAMGPAGRPYRDFLTAMGLARNGRARGITVGVFLILAGRIQAEMSQAGATCTDTGGFGVVSAAVGISRPGASGGAFAGGWRSRCPGPLFGVALPGVAASVAPGAVGHRQFAIDVRGQGAAGDDGYVISPGGGVTAVMRRGSLTSQFETFPAP